METLGKRWAVANATITDDGSNKQQVFTEAQQRLEQQAQNIFSTWKSSLVPERVEECMRSRADHVGLPMEAWLLNTHAFADFRAWLSEQGLSSHCVYPPEDDPDFHEGENVIIIVMPHSSAH